MILQKAFGNSPLSMFLMAACTSSLEAETPRWLYLESLLTIKILPDVSARKSNTIFWYRQLLSGHYAKLHAVVEGSGRVLVAPAEALEEALGQFVDRKSTRLNSSHVRI